MLWRMADHAVICLIFIPVGSGPESCFCTGAILTAQKSLAKFKPVTTVVHLTRLVPMTPLISRVALIQSMWFFSFPRRLDCLSQ